MGDRIDLGRLHFWPSGHGRARVGGCGKVKKGQDRVGWQESRECTEDEIREKLFGKRGREGAGGEDVQGRSDANVGVGWNGVARLGALGKCVVLKAC